MAKAKTAKIIPSSAAPAPPPAATKFEYDAVKTTGRRRAPSTKLVAEHVMLPDSKRKKMLATIQDQQRNASTCAWMIRRHLDYVSRFRFQFRTGKPAIDSLVNRIFEWHAQPRNFDIASRFGREEMFRMFEMEKVMGGDAAMVKLSTMHLQAIESDLIAYPKSGLWNVDRNAYDPLDVEAVKMVDKDTGVIMSRQFPGRIDQYCICNRGPDGKTVAFDHLEGAENVIFDAYWTRFSSQVRGVSPLTTAINLIQDSYEGIDFNLAKAKVHALFGIALMRDYSGYTSDQHEVNAWGSGSGIGTGQDENALSAAESEAGTKQIASTAQELKPGEMMMVDMDLKGRIDTIESKTPSTEFREFQELVLRLAFIALDIPYSAFNSRSTSFSGMIADQNLYEVSCRWKRDKNRYKRYEYSDWLVRMVWDSKEWKLSQVAAENGMTLSDITSEIEWVASGFPWLQKLQEVQGDVKAMAAMLDNPIDACKRRGTDFFENVRKTKQAHDYAKENNVAIMIGEPGQSSIADLEPDTETEEDIEDE